MPEAARIDATGGATEVQASGSNHAAGLGLGHGALGFYEDRIYSGLEKCNGVGVSEVSGDHEVTLWLSLILTGCRASRSKF